MVASPSIAFMADGTGLRGVFTHKNVLGWAACVGVILSIGLMQDAASLFGLRGLLMLVPSLVCLVFTGSATSIFSVAIGVVLFGFYGLLHRTSGLKQAMLILLALEVTGVILLFLEQLLVPLLQSLGKDATLTGRVPLWALVDTRIAERPWLGYGYQAFWVPGKQQVLWITSILQWSPPHAHNGYRDILLNFGVVGLGLFAVVIVQSIRKGASLHRAAPREGWAWMNVMVGVMLSLNLTESNILTQNDLWWLILMTIIASFALRWPEADDTAASRGPRSA
jgi:exopolysaccharide production protein ExoQ